MHRDGRYGPCRSLSPPNLRSKVIIEDAALPCQVGRDNPQITQISQTMSPRSGRLKIAQHFSAGIQARLAPESVKRTAESLQDPGR